MSRQQPIATSYFAFPPFATKTLDLDAVAARCQVGIDILAAVTVPQFNGEMAKHVARRLKVLRKAIDGIEQGDLETINKGITALFNEELKWTPKCRLFSHHQLSELSLNILKKILANPTSPRDELKTIPDYKRALTGKEQELDEACKLHDRERDARRQAEEELAALRASQPAEAATVPLGSIRMDGGTQLRLATDEATLEQYTEAIKGGATFPPVVVFFDGVDHWLADGFHTCEAHRRAKKDKVRADIRQGTQRDAILYAAGANQEHGLRRSDADKRRAVEALLKDDEWAKWSDREIAKRCRVGNRFVGDVRRELSVSGHRCADTADERVGGRKATRNGTTYTVQTKKIGKAEPTTSPPAVKVAASPPDPQPERQAVVRVVSGDVLREAWRKANKQERAAFIRWLAAEGHA